MKPHQINSDKAGLFTGRKGVRFQLLLTSTGGSLWGVWILAMAPDGSCLVGAETRAAIGPVSTPIWQRHRENVNAAPTADLFVVLNFRPLLNDWSPPWPEHLSIH
jgi:hypothetical protein